MKKLFAVLLVTILSIGMLAACNSNREQPTQQSSASTSGAETQPAAQEPQKQLRFTFINPVVGHPYWSMVDDGVKKAAEEFNIDLNITGPNQVDANQQIQAIETAIAAKVDGIVTMALNPESFTPVLNKAMDEGIPVIVLDGDAPESKRIAFFGSNNFNAGKKVGETIVEWSGGAAKVGVITAGLDIGHLNDRIDGMKEVFQGTNAQVVDIQDSRGDTILAIEKTTAMLQAYPEIDVLFAVGASDGPGVAKAVEDLKLNGKVKIMAFDDIPQTLDYIKKGVVTACIAQRPTEMGYQAVKALFGIVADKQYPAEKINDTGVNVVTLDNIDTYNKN